jgi:hypothetical protein
LQRRTPAEGFNTREPDAGPAVNVNQVLVRRDGDGWISRRVASNGIISVAWQQISCGKYRAGRPSASTSVTTLWRSGPATT